MSWKWVITVMTFYCFISGCGQGKPQAKVDQKGPSSVAPSGEEQIREKNLSNSAKGDLPDQQEVGKGKGSLLFFLNPRGGPCKRQGKILADITSEIEEYVLIYHVATDDPRARSDFYKYGVRGLPAIILLNSDGDVARRFTPGIQDSKVLLEAVKNL